MKLFIFIHIHIQKIGLKLGVFQELGRLFGRKHAFSQLEIHKHIN